MKLDFTSSIFKNFSQDELKVLEYMFNNIDEYIYINRRISFLEEEILNFLNKKPTEKNQEWLKCYLLDLTSRKIIDDTNDFPFFQSIKITTNKENKTVINICINEIVYNELFVQND